MIQIDSFDDFEIPAELFPPESYLHLKIKLSYAVNYLAGFSVDEVNSSLLMTREIVRLINNVSKETEPFNLKTNKPLSSFDIIPLPTKVRSEDNLLIQHIDKSFNDNSKDYLKDEIKNNQHIDQRLIRYNILLGSTSLYYYLLGIKIAKRIQLQNKPNNSSYYRLGKVMSLFMTADYFLTLLSQITNEINAVKAKENQLEGKRKETASKGGKQKNTSFNQLKKKCINLYNENFTKRSNRDAASQVYKLLSDNDKSIFRGDDPKHQITIWIGQYKNGKLTLD